MSVVCNQYVSYRSNPSRGATLGSRCVFSSRADRAWLITHPGQVKLRAGLPVHWHHLVYAGFAAEEGDEGGEVRESVFAPAEGVNQQHGVGGGESFRLQQRRGRSVNQLIANGPRNVVQAKGLLQRGEPFLLARRFVGIPRPLPTPPPWPSAERPSSGPSVGT